MRLRNIYKPIAIFGVPLSVFSITALLFVATVLVGPLIGKAIVAILMVASLLVGRHLAQSIGDDAPIRLIQYGLSKGVWSKRGHHD